MKKKKIHLGDKIKRMRSFKGYTQHDLAKGIGKTRTLISYLERTGNINKYTMIEIADFLKVSMEEIESIGEHSNEYFINSTATDNYETLSWLRNLVEEQKEEINFLKKTISQQMDLLKKLSGNKLSKNNKGLGRM